MAKKKGDHVVMRNGSMFCSHCGRYQAIAFPMEIPVFVAMSKAFTKSHLNCAPVWKEPEPAEGMSESERARFWLENGEHGGSSKTMFAVIGFFPSVRNVREYVHPSDPDDFKRCMKLLKCIPQWRSRLDLMKAVSPIWERLVDNWDKLTAMYEAQDSTMYDFMQKIIRNDIT